MPSGSIQIQRCLRQRSSLSHVGKPPSRSQSRRSLRPNERALTAKPAKAQTARRPKALLQPRRPPLKIHMWTKYPSLMPSAKGREALKAKPSWRNLQRWTALKPKSKEGSEKPRRWRMNRTKKIFLVRRMRRQWVHELDHLSGRIDRMGKCVASDV